MKHELRLQLTYAHSIAQLPCLVKSSGCNSANTNLLILDEVFDHVVLATPAWDAAHLMATLNPAWSQTASALTHEAIATVYIQMPRDFKLPQPMLSLPSSKEEPAQFVFDKGALSSQHGMLAAVVSACKTERDDVTEQVHMQVCEQLKLQHLDIVQTVVEKRATLACTPMLDRPESYVAAGLWACGDYICGPYPSTLEGAVRSGQQVVAQLGQVTHR